MGAIVTVISLIIGYIAASLLVDYEQKTHGITNFLNGVLNDLKTFIQNIEDYIQKYSEHKKNKNGKGR